MEEARVKEKVIFILIAIALIFIPGIKMGVNAAEDSARVISKLDKVLANQAEMFKQFDEIKQELKVIKIRATR